MGKKKREVIELDYDTISDFWDDLYFEKSSTELDGVKFTNVDRTNYSNTRCDGECYDYIVKRESDGKCFKYSWWEGGSDGHSFSDGDNTLTEVFPEVITTTIYK